MPHDNRPWFFVRACFAVSALLLASACGSEPGRSSDAGARDAGGRDAMHVVPGPPSGDCGSVRLTQYQANSRGWCEFPRDLPVLPAFVRDGMTAAIGEPWNGGSYDGDPGEACGECWEVDTVWGTRTVMISDLCPIAGNPLCAGDQFHMDLASEAATALRGGGLDEGEARRVACPVEGNVHVLVNDENVTYLRIQFLNQRIPVRSVEFRGAGTVAGSNEWTPARRSGGAWEVIGGDRPTDRGGSGVNFRITSAQGQVVESSAVVASHPAHGTTFDLGVQFTDTETMAGGSCVFTPPADVFVEGWGGIDDVMWSINPWGEAEGNFFGETHDGCFNGSASCLLIERLDQWNGFHLYYRQRFPAEIFSRARFRIRTRTGTTTIGVSGSDDGNQCMGTRIDIGPEWAEGMVDLSATCGGFEQLNGLTFNNTGSNVALYLDDVRLIP